MIPRLLNLRFVLFFLDFCSFHFLLMVAIGGMTDELARAEIEAKINSSTPTFPNNQHVHEISFESNDAFVGESTMLELSMSWEQKVYILQTTRQLNQAEKRHFPNRK